MEGQLQEELAQVQEESPRDVFYALANWDCDFFLDTNSFQKSEEGLFKSAFFSRRSFLEITPEKLDEISQRVEIATKIFHTPRTYSTSKVVVELRRLVEEHLKPHLDLLMRRSKYPREEYVRERQRFEEGKDSVTNMLFAYSKLLRAADRRAFLPEKMDFFDTLEQFIVDVGRKTHVRDYSPEDLNTDEQVLATAIYNSLMNPKKSTIISRDSHIRNLLRQVTQTMLNNNGKYERILAKLKANSVAVYVLDDDCCLKYRANIRDYLNAAERVSKN